MDKSGSEKCSVCGQPLTTPFQKKRGVHKDCSAAKSSGSYVEK